MVTGFYAYDSKMQNAKESVHETITSLKSQHLMSIDDWMGLRTGSRLILTDILKKIDEAKIFCADCTSLNPNVLFELGYAIAKNKEIFLSLDISKSATEKDFREFGLLAPVRWHSSKNDEELFDGFKGCQYFRQEGPTLYSQLIEEFVVENGTGNVLYLKPSVNTNASRRISRILTTRKIEVRVNDPSESIQTLSWFVREISQCSAVLCHMLGKENQDAEMWNARNGLLAGLAFGFKKKLLIVAENSFQVPFDYQTILSKYSDANSAAEIVANWINPFEQQVLEDSAKIKSIQIQNRQYNELRNLSLGQSVAELEVELLTHEYFVETHAYNEALAGNTNIFVGRKGVGKSATLYKLKQDIESEHKQNFVCLVKPESYEISGLVSIIRDLGVDRTAFALQSIWKYLLLTEIAVQLCREITAKPAYTIDKSESDLVKWLDDNDRLTRGDIATRLEDVIKQVQQLVNVEKPMLDWRELVSESLHSGPIKQLNLKLRDVLKSKRRVAIIIDNLDKAWDAGSDAIVLSEFILALLTVTSSSKKLFDRNASELVDTRITMTLFLRSDILHRVRKAAREADKLTYHTIKWTDFELLERVIDERVRYQSKGQMTIAEFWQKYFEDPIMSREYILNTIVPRPRDLIRCVEAVTNAAINRRHSKVSPEDVKKGLEDYSRFAIDSMVTESKITEFDVEGLVTEFIGCDSIVTVKEIKDLVDRSGTKAPVESVIRELCLVGFLGPKVGPTTFSWIEDVDDYDRILRKANIQGVKSKEGLKYSIKPAFWPFLEIAKMPSKPILHK